MFGRYRRFVKSADRMVIGEQERQAQNFPIQSTVADAVSLALKNLYNYRREHTDVMYRIVLQIHDAVLLEVPYEYVSKVCKEVMPTCMVGQVPIYPRTLGNQPISVQTPYHFGIDTEVCLNWGETLNTEELLALGIAL